MKRSKCPISNALDYFGDKWSLLVLRDIILYNKKTFKELQESEEHIATNILTDRLSKLESAGLIRRDKHPKDKRRSIYLITKKGLDTLPVIIELMIWSKKYYPKTYIPDEFWNQVVDDKEVVIAKITADRSE